MNGSAYPRLSATPGKSPDCRLHHLLVLINRAAAGPHRADHRVALLDRHTAREDDDSLVVGTVDTKQRLARLCHFRQVLGRHVEGTRSKGLMNGNIDAAKPGAIHAHVADQ